MLGKDHELGQSHVLLSFILSWDKTPPHTATAANPTKLALKPNVFAMKPKNVAEESSKTHRGLYRALQKVELSGSMR